MARTRTASERTQETRSRLVEAAIAEVAERGFHAATVEAIASRAGYSIGALYWNFAGKDALFLAVFDEHVAWFEARLESVVAAEDPARAAADWLELSARRPDQFLVFVEFWAYAVRTPKLRPAFAERMSRLRQATERALADRAGSSGRTAAIAPELAATLILAVGRGLALEMLADPDAVDIAPLAHLLSAVTG